MYRILTAYGPCIEKTLTWLANMSVMGERILIKSASFQRRLGRPTNKFEASRSHVESSSQTRPTSRSDEGLMPEIIIGRVVVSVSVDIERAESAKSTVGCR